MPRKKKLGLIALFAVTILVIAVAVSRYISIESVSKTRPRAHIATDMITIKSPGFTGAKRSTDWAFREVFISIAMSNLPIIVSSATAWNRARKRSYTDLELGTSHSTTTYNTTTQSTKPRQSKEEN